MKKTGKIITVILAVMMFLATMAIPALGASAQGLLVDDTTENGSITVNKYLVVDKDSPIPNETFTFTLTPVEDTTGMTSEEQAIKSGIAVANSSANIAFTNIDTTTLGSTASDEANITKNGADEKYATGTATISFAGANFTTPGIYRYTLEETNGANGNITYDLSKFYVDIYVGYEDADSDAGEMKILGVKTFRYQDAEGEAILIGDKTTNQFSNTFADYTLVVSKKVTGNMGDRDKEFSFTLTVDENTLLSNGTVLAAVKTNADNTTSASSVTVGTEYTFTLKHGESIEVKGLPEGTSYTVTEADYTGDSYSTSHITTENGVEGTAVATGTSENEIVAGGNAEEFINHKNITTPTGILLDIAPYALVVLIAVAAAAMMISKKRRRSIAE